MCENKKRALDILIESLKLYVSISTFFIGGLLTYYFVAKPILYLQLFFVALLTLVVSVVTSVFNVNHLVSKVYRGDNDIYKKFAKFCNFLAVITFSLGIILAGLFMYLNRPVPSSSSSTSNGIKIKGDSIVTGNDVDTKVLIKRDKNGKTSE